MDLIRHARRRSRGHACKHAERTAAAPARHTHEGSHKAPQYECTEREWRRERSRACRTAPAAPAAPEAATAGTSYVPATPAPAAPLSAPLASLFPPTGH